MIVPEGAFRLADPLQTAEDPEDVGTAGVVTNDGTDGGAATLGAAANPLEAAAEPPDPVENDAVKPEPSTDPSDVNAMYMLPDDATSCAGRLEPLSTPNTLPEGELPSNTINWSYPASVENALKERVIAEPEISH